MNAKSHKSAEILSFYRRILKTHFKAVTQAAQPVRRQEAERQRSCRHHSNPDGVVEDPRLLLLERRSRDAAGPVAKEGFANEKGPFASRASCVQLLPAQLLVTSVAGGRQQSLALCQD